MAKDPLEEYKFKEKLELGKLKPKSEELHKISCPSCAQTVPADNLNIQTNMAKCSSCDGIFSFGKELEQFSYQESVSQEILQPEGVEINHFRDELDISVAQPWGSAEVIFISLVPLLLILAPLALTTFFIYT